MQWVKKIKYTIQYNAMQCNTIIFVTLPGGAFQSLSIYLKIYLFNYNAIKIYSKICNELKKIKYWKLQDKNLQLWKEKN